MSKKIGYVWNTLYSWVDTGTGGLLSANLTARIQPSYQHLAHPDTKRRFNELVQTSGQIDYLTPVPAKAATDEDILRVHSVEMLNRVKQLSALATGGVASDGVTNIGNGGIEIAYLSAGGAIELTKKVVSGELSTGYALINPPGHHATRNATMGFCYFNNTSIAAAYAKEVLGVKRIAIVDWDVHHGNGTQDIWYTDPSVLTISIHQDRCFPSDSGFIDERGEAAGLGYNLNIPLPPGSGNAAYQYAFENAVIPALKQYQPELIIVGSGFDASILDPLSRMMVTTEGFKNITAQVLECANTICNGKIVFVQEGGYSPHYVPFCGLAVIQTLTSVESIHDPFLDFVGSMGGETLLEHEKSIVDQVIPFINDL